MKGHALTRGDLPGTPTKLVTLWENKGMNWQESAEGIVLEKKTGKA